MTMPSAPEGTSVKDLLKISELGKTVRASVKWGTLLVIAVSCCYTTIRVFDSLAGKKTDASIDIQVLASWVTEFGIDTKTWTAAFVILVAGILLLIGILRMVIVKVGDHASQLELQLDANKQSSRVTKHGRDPLDLKGVHDE